MHFNGIFHCIANLRCSARSVSGISSLPANNYMKSLRYFFFPFPVLSMKGWVLYSSCCQQGFQQPAVPLAWDFCAIIRGNKPFFLQSASSTTSLATKYLNTLSRRCRGASLTHPFSTPFSFGALQAFLARVILVFQPNLLNTSINFQVEEDAAADQLLNTLSL